MRICGNEKGLTKPTNTSSENAASDVRNALGHGPSKDNLSRKKPKSSIRFDEHAECGTKQSVGVVMHHSLLFGPIFDMVTPEISW